MAHPFPLCLCRTTLAYRETFDPSGWWRNDQQMREVQQQQRTVCLSDSRPDDLHTRPRLRQVECVYLLGPSVGMEHVGINRPAARATKQGQSSQNQNRAKHQHVRQPQLARQTPADSWVASGGSDMAFHASAWRRSTPLAPVPSTGPRLPVSNIVNGWCSSAGTYTHMRLK